jgi:hypothetical protein
VTDKVTARKMVLVSAFLLAAIAVYRDRKDGASDTFRALWGVGVLSMLLSLLADFAPGVAGPFAALTVLGSLVSGDVSILDKVLGTAGRAPVKSKAAAAKGATQ